MRRPSEALSEIKKMLSKALKMLIEESLTTIDKEYLCWTKKFGPKM